MNKDKVKQVLEIIYQHMPKSVKWRMEGCSNLILLGVDTEPKRIGIVVAEDHFDEAVAAFAHYTPHVDRDDNSKFAKFKIEEEDVALMVYDDERLQALDEIILLNDFNMNIPVLPLDKSKKFYELKGREDKVKLLDQYL